MKRFGLSILLLAGAGYCGAQQWELGAVGGAGFLNNVGVSSPLGAATTGFQTGAAGGVYVAHDTNAIFGGEIRYAYLQSNLKLSANGSQATFPGQAHVLHYDFIVHTRSRGAKRQLFLAVGGGMKIFRGTGQESASQPLNQFGYFTKTQVLKPMASIGAGVKFAITRNLILRTEIRDYITAFPTDLIAPAPGAKFGSILQDLVPMAGLSYVF